jgi:hypothetical protein
MDGLMLTVDDLRRAAKSDDAELAAAREEHASAWRAHQAAGGSFLSPSYDAVRSANDRIGKRLRGLMG